MRHIQRALKPWPALAAVGCLPLALAGCGSVDGESSGDESTGTSSAELRSAVTPELQASPIYQAYQAYLQRSTQRVAVAGGVSDTLASYAARCDLATGIHVASFTCDNGQEIPGQTVTNGVCNRPNVLNGQCDPGSKFQVLPGQTADAVAVAHCRKVGLATGNTTYNDVAVIQYNKKTGAACFYQALGDHQGRVLEGNAVPAPGADDTGFWIDPKGTENIKCTGCHTTGGFVRSSYLAQLENMPEAKYHLPSTAEGYDNNTTPLKFVGLDFATNRTWSVATNRAASDSGLACTTCHRMGVSNELGFDVVNGSAGQMGLTATAAQQASKEPHSPQSPIWMRPNQNTFDAGAFASAGLFNSCATAGWIASPATPTSPATMKSEGFTFMGGVSGCSYTPLGALWMGFDAAQLVSSLSIIDP